MVQIEPMTEEETMKMYMKLPKKELASMLTQRDIYPPTEPFVYKWDDAITSTKYWANKLRPGGGKRL